MATLGDIGLAATINILTAFVFLLAFAVLRLQPYNDRVYFPKWYIKGVRSSPTNSGSFVQKFVNLDFRSYITFLQWIPAALKMPEPELIEHAGLDSAVYLRIYLLGLKIFAPICILAFAILVPVNWTNNTLEIEASKESDLEFSTIDKISISNIPTGSNKFWAHLVMAYTFTFWTCYVLFKEYAIIAKLRLHFLASQKRRPDQFTVLVRNVPADPDESTYELVEHFFLVNHPEHFLTHQVVYDANKLSKLVGKKKAMKNWLDYYKLKYERNSSKRPNCKTGFFGLYGKKVDAIEYYTSEIDKLSKEEVKERDRLKKDPKSVMPTAFVSFKSRWGAAVCAQTQQSRNPTIWLTEWSPEPRDVYWSNLAIPFVNLNIRRLIIGVIFFFLTFFFIIPIAIVQSMANIEGIEEAVPFLKPLIEVPFIKSFIQGFLPGIVLKIFLIFLPMILMIMVKFEGFISISSLERRAATKYYIFLFVNVFLGSIIAGTAFQQIETFIHQSVSEFPKTIGIAIPQKATFFITYVMVDGWAGVAGEILRLKPLIVYHLKNIFLVKTEKDREEAMDPGSIEFNANEPKIQLYFLLGLVYAVVAPFLLPYIMVFFGLAYLVFRHQIINVYNQRYESAAAFWPNVHGRVIVAMVASQIVLLGLLSTKKAANSTPFLIALPVLTIWFHSFCKNRYESAFRKFPLQEAGQQAGGLGNSRTAVSVAVVLLDSSFLCYESHGST
ncbi:calcium permeable stress-gated cation channel 1-like [Dendrobium catenatum]|uniref:calcium permeable stress-gated cation channel 1-like n=1 Tax=Dendrobium catenatum TaxID=906689 RepID=UPI0009F20454|nr:calcium permeable stress-gated cation channel 1-like [Dendrobium catenatum]